MSDCRSDLERYTEKRITLDRRRIILQGGRSCCRTEKGRRGKETKGEMAIYTVLTELQNFLSTSPLRRAPWLLPVIVKFLAQNLSFLKKYWVSEQGKAKNVRNSIGEKYLT